MNLQPIVHHASTRAPNPARVAPEGVKIQKRNDLCDLFHSLRRPARRALQAREFPIIKGFRMSARRRKIVVALWILLVASLVLVPKFVVSRSNDTQKETCDPISAFSKQYV